MHNYSFDFRMIGEVADMLHLRSPEQKLLVDVSADAPGHEKTTVKKYPNRSTLTITNAGLIEYILSEVSIGDIIDAAGTFTQTNYIPYRTTCIDTTFLTRKFIVLEKPMKSRSQFDTRVLHRSYGSVH